MLMSVQALVQENEGLQKQVEKFEQDGLKLIKEEWKKAIINQNGVNLLVVNSPMEPAHVKDIAFQLRGEVKNLILVAGGVAGDKPNLTIMISNNLVEELGLNAGQLIREAAKEIKGGGGGQPFLDRKSVV